jgi:hypothetical protein
MVRKILSPTILVKIIDPLEKFLELPKRVPQSLQQSLRTLGFFSKSEKLNP